MREDRRTEFIGTCCFLALRNVFSSERLGEYGQDAVVRKEEVEPRQQLPADFELVVLGAKLAEINDLQQGRIIRNEAKKHE